MRTVLHENPGQLGLLSGSLPELLREELVACGILVNAGVSRDGQTQFSFLHRTFLEFLAARNLAGEQGADMG